MPQDRSHDCTLNHKLLCALSTGTTDIYSCSGNLINAIGMQRRQWDYTVFNDAEEETEVTKLSQNNFFFFTVCM